jgi:hypothetical protein
MLKYDIKLVSFFFFFECSCTFADILYVCFAPDGNVVLNVIYLLHCKKKVNRLVDALRGLFDQKRI